MKAHIIIGDRTVASIRLDTITGVAQVALFAAALRDPVVVDAGLGAFCLQAAGGSVRLYVEQRAGE